MAFTEVDYLNGGGGGDKELYTFSTTLTDTNWVSTSWTAKNMMMLVFNTGNKSAAWNGWIDENGTIQELYNPSNNMRAQINNGIVEVKSTILSYRADTISAAALG